MNINSHVVVRTAIWSLVVLVIIVIGFLVLKPDNSYQGGDPVQKASELEIKSFTLGGEVTALGKNQITIKTGWVEEGKFVYYDRIVKITPETTAQMFIKGDKFDVANKDLASYFLVGDKVTIHGSGNPYITETITATKIEVQR